MFYTGVQEIILSEKEVARFYESNQIDIKDLNLLTNEYVIIKDFNNNIIDKRKWNGDKLIKLKKYRFKNIDVLKPLDDIQLFAYDALFSKDIKVVCLIGKSGTGKTRSALSVGLELLKQDIYEKIILIRHAVELGSGIGYLPGTKMEKMRNWASCFVDNLPGKTYELDELLRTEKIEIESLSMLKGRDLKNSYIIFDEAEDATIEQMEVVGTRCCDSSKFVVIGDYRQVSHRKFYNNSGLLQLINNAQKKDWFCCLELQTNGRGEVASFFANEYKIDEFKEDN